MTIPTRQAPPPPINSQINRNFALSASSTTQNTTTHRTRNNNNTSRYTPTTDWDDKPFANDPFEPWNKRVAPPVPPPVTATQQPVNRYKKPPPPRPPPPRIGSKTAPKKPSSLHSNTILANLLSRARLSKNTNKTTTNGPVPKVPAPAVPATQPSYGAISWNANLKPSASFSSTSSAMSVSSGPKELISFDSPPSSPTFTQKSNSDCVSVDSFSSDSNYSPNNGFSSQAESGFEDDFGLDAFKTPSQPRSTRSTPVDPFDLLDDPFTAPAQTTGYKPPVSQKPGNVGNASFYAFSGTTMTQTSSSSSLSSINTNKPGAILHDTLCNGKDLIVPPPSRALPTIIRPAASSMKPKISPKHTVAPAVVSQALDTDTSSDDSSLDDSIVSPPMPNMPPPAPPKEYFEEVASTTPDTFDDQEKESYGIALYDFNGEQDDDLSFRAGDKIYLVRQLNDQWYFGRDRRGCEGMFPMNYLDVKIPLADSAAMSNGASGASTPSLDKPIQVRALYDFHAETPEDLELRVNDVITVLYAVNEEWLFGENNGKRGQFPANFIDYQ